MKNKIIYTLKINLLWKIIILLSLTKNIYGQDTIKLKNTPKIILHSWYPEYKSSPKFKIGESKIIMTLTPDLDSTELRNCIIDLRTKNNFINIKETGKINPSHFIVKVNQTDQKYAEFDVWILIENKTIMVLKNGKYIDLRDLFLVEENKIKIDTIKVELIK